MKRILALLLILVFSFPLFACAPKPIPEPEPEPPVEVEPAPVEVDPAPVDPRQTPMAIAFYNAPKEPWGEKDFYLYSFEGDITAAIDQNREPDYMFINMSRYPNTITYRNIAVGDDAKEALSRMQLPLETLVIVLPSVDGVRVYPDDAIPYDSETDYPLEMTRFRIYFNRDFEVVDVSQAYPFTENTDAYWGVIILIEDGKITNYIAGKLLYQTKER